MGHDLNRHHLADPVEQFGEIRLGGVEGKVTHVQTGAGDLDGFRLARVRALSEPGSRLGREGLETSPDWAGAASGVLFAVPFVGRFEEGNDLLPEGLGAGFFGPPLRRSEE